MANPITVLQPFSNCFLEASIKRTFNGHLCSFNIFVYSVLNYKNMSGTV